jgi:hypothetical protein
MGGIDELLWQKCAASNQMKMLWVVFSNVSDTRRDLDGAGGETNAITEAQVHEMECNLNPFCNYSVTADCARNFVRI